jgi:hypothetical protein
MHKAPPKNSGLADITLTTTLRHTPTTSTPHFIQKTSFYPQSSGNVLKTSTEFQAERARKKARQKQKSPSSKGWGFENMPAIT